MTQINMEIGARPSLEWIDVDLIDVDRNYQRDVDGRRVEKILEGFRWDHFGAVVLARKPDGRFSVTDGQHRCKAAQLHPDITQVPALVTAIEGTIGEAENFLVINRARKAVTSIETFWAGLTAGDHEAQRLRDVLQRADCDVAPGSGDYRPGLTNAVTAIGRCLERYGDAATVKALKVIRTAWPDDAKALRGTLITALARLYRNNAEIDSNRLAKVIAGKTPAELTGFAESFRKLSGGAADTALSKAITELYNKGLSVKLIHFGAAG